MLNNSIVPLSHYRKWLIPFQDEKTREFIRKAKLVHGDKYDYRFVKYINSKEKVCILCKLHGEFWQSPNNHLKGSGCYYCGKVLSIDKRRDDNSLFIIKSKLTHGNKYDYSKTLYKNSNEKVCIICPEHGEFWQTPSNHIAGSGCPICGRENQIKSATKTTEDFKNNSRLMHGNKYNYDKTFYKDNITKVIITCPIHGDFKQRPNDHLNGHGCPICGRELANKKNSSNEQKFISRSNTVHNNKYDYDKVRYINSGTKVIITCPIHGDFEQTPNDHLNGHGCPLCGRDNISFKKLKTTESFVESANQIHGEKYIYDKTIYRGNNKKVTITCPIHGDFEQTPHSHLNGSGCPTCASLTNVCESYIGEWLSKNNIDSIHRYTVPDLIKNSNNIIIDYKVILTLIIWIEYNGLQHYEFVDFFHNGNIENFKSQLKRDEKVRNYCNKNGIRLIEIPYIYNTRESIFEFLDNVITKGIDPYTFVNYESLFKRPLDYIPYSENENK